MTHQQKEFLRLNIILQHDYTGISAKILPYDQLNNVVLACYWCNNAKTDTFTYEEFKEVGKVFANIWKYWMENEN